MAYNPPLLRAALMHMAEGRSVIPLADKVPAIKWKALQNRLATEKEAREWFQSTRSRQLAMVLGRISGSLWVMDADGPAAVDWLERNAPPTTVYTRTRRGRHAYYRMPAGVEVRNGTNVIPEIKLGAHGDQIDVRGEGGYAVIPPSPYRGGEYRWEIKGQGWAGLPVWQPPAKSAAVSTCEADRLNLDLSGVKTFNDCRPVAKGERNSELARLAGGMLARGLSPEEVLVWAAGWNFQNSPPLPRAEVTRTVESIAGLHLRNHGSLAGPPQRNVSLPSSLGPAETGSSIVIAPTAHGPGGGVETAAKARPQTQTAEGPPEEILRPGGVLEMTMDYLEKSTVASYPLFSLAAALALVGTLMGQKVMTETGLRTNLYIFALAPSGTGKDAPLAAIPHLLLEAGASDDNLGPGHLASSAGLLSRLSAKPCQLLLIDEIGDLLGSLKNKNDVAKNDLPKILKSLYSSTARGEIKAYAEAKNNVNIPWHHLSFYATGVPGDFWRNLSISDVTGGFIARALLFSLDLLAPFPREEVVIDPPPQLVEAIRKLNRIERRHQGNLMTSPAPRMVLKTREAKEAFTRWHRGCHELQNEHRHNPDGRAAIYARAAENAHKLALIHAVSLAGGLPENVPLESVRFAAGLMDWMIPRLVEQMAANISHNEQDALRKRILSLVAKKGSVSKRDIYTNLNGCSSKMAEDAIRILEETGDLTPVEIIKTNGRSSLVWARPEPRWPIDGPEAGRHGRPEPA